MRKRVRFEEQGSWVSKNGAILATTRRNPGGGDGTPIRSTRLDLASPSLEITTQKYKVSPWGTNNDFPTHLLEAISENNLVPGLIEFKEDMIYGSGLEFLDSTGNPVQNKAFSEWLDSWDYLEFFESQLADYLMYYNVFGQIIKKKGKQEVAKLVHIDAGECRCERMINNRVNHILVADWVKSRQDLMAYPTYDRYVDYSKQKDITMYHSFRKAPGHKYYGVPAYLGAIKYWVPLMDQIPQYHLNMLKNSLNILYHVEIPVEILEYKKNNNGLTQAQAEEWVQAQVDTLSEMLTGIENAGKTFYSFTTQNPNGGKDYVGWKIMPIENKAKQLSEGYLKLYNDGNQAITSALQVPVSLACLQLGSGMSSGSEILNAYNVHSSIRTLRPRLRLLESFNIAIRINFPGGDIHPTIRNIRLVQQDVDKSGIAKSEV